MQGSGGSYNNHEDQPDARPPKSRRGRSPSHRSRLRFSLRYCPFPLRRNSLPACVAACALALRWRRAVGPSCGLDAGAVRCRSRVRAVMAVAVVVIYRDVAMNEGLAVSALRPEADIWAGLQHVALCHRQKCRYSITSARARSVGGISNPSDFAALILLTNWNLEAFRIAA